MFKRFVSDQIPEDPFLSMTWTIQTQGNYYNTSVQKQKRKKKIPVTLAFTAPRRQYTPHDTLIITNVSDSADYCCLLFNQGELQ